MKYTLANNENFEIESGLTTYDVLDMLESQGGGSLDPNDYYTKDEIDNAGYLTGYTETDPTVPSWAKAENKPTYTASEVGAISTATTIPTATSQLTNDSNFVVDASYVHTDNNYTSTEKSKLSGIAEGAEVNVQPDWNQTGTTADDYIKNKPTIPTATSQLTNDSNFVVDASYAHTDNNYSTTEKNKLNGIAEGAEVNVQSDWNQTGTTADDYIKNKPTIPTTTSQLTNDSNFVVDASYVHTDNNYTSTEKAKLSGIAEGAEVNIQPDWNQTGTTADDYIKNKPSIPTETTVSNWGFTKNAGTITGITMNGQSMGTSGNVDLGTVITEHQSLENYATTASVVNLDKIPYSSTSAAASVTIEPYKMYDFGTLSTAMTISFDTSKEISGYARQYMLRFVAGEGCDITLPNGVYYLNNVEPVFTTGRTYEFDITNMMCVFGEFYYASN